ncbi:MAG: hypothetical protein HYX23_02210 [Candidatus Zambryskibacteria bacterium]|nr:hypothetical protein [Candidatus Zambryskibacteria bacterium]
MPKHIEDIVVPERKRSIRDIPIPEGRRRIERREMPQTSKENYSFNDSSPDNSFNFPPNGGSSANSRGRRKWIAISIAALILIFPILSVFGGATLAYVPKSQAVSFDGGLYEARKEGESGLLFSIVKLSMEKGQEVSTSGEQEVERKASGTIVVYNASIVEQRLRATTRFETPDGKIYQVPDAIVIPGKKLVNGEEKLGALEVVVYAERPGQGFNIGFADFTLPGLKGTSLFASVYARSKTEMSGGFSGTEKIIKSEDGARVREQLETALKEGLISEAKAQVPEDFILLPSLSSVTFKELPQSVPTNGEGVMINMSADLAGVMFKRSDLSRELVVDKVTLAAGESLNIDKLDSLEFALTNNASINPLSSNKISFSVRGETTIEWNVDEVALKADLLGRSKQDLPSILNNYPTVAKATATIRPFWKSSFPENGADIFLKKLPVK